MVSKVLYVEDDEDILEVVESCFMNSSNIKVLKSTKRSNALEILKNNNIKCVISDYSMPNNNMDCFEFFEEVNKIEEDIPFVIFTGKGSEDIASKSLSLGVDDYIQKGNKDALSNLFNSVKTQVIKYNNSQFSKLTNKSPIDIIENTEGGIFIMDEDYNIIYSNNKSNKLFSSFSDFNSIEGENLKDITEGPKKFYDLCKESLETGERKIDVAYNKKFKEWFSFKIQPKKNKLTVMFNSLKGNNKTNIYQKVVSNTNDIITILGENGIVKYQTPSITKFGYEQDELYGKNIFEKIHPEDREDVINTFKKLKNEPKEKELVVEYRLKTKNNNYIWCESISMHDSNIDEMGFVISTRIISKRKEKERELELKNERLKEIISIMNHDIPNHLTIVKGAMYKIKDEYPKAAERIENGCNRIQELLKDLKEISTEKELNKKSNSIEGLISEISLDKDVEIEIEDNFDIFSDPLETKKLLENLIWNSIKHNDEEVKMRIGLLDNKNGFFVEDTGKGLENKNKYLIWDIQQNQVIVEWDYHL